MFKTGVSSAKIVLKASPLVLLLVGPSIQVSSTIPWRELLWMCSGHCQSHSMEISTYLLLVTILPVTWVEAYPLPNQEGEGASE